MSKSKVTWAKIKESTSLLNMQSTDTTLEQRQNDDLSHWLLKLGFCRTNELKRWFLTNEVALFKLRFTMLNHKLRKSLYKKHNLDFPIIPKEEIANKKSLLQDLIVSNKTDVLGTDWYRVPFHHVNQLGKHLTWQRSNNFLRQFLGELFFHTKLKILFLNSEISYLL